MYAPIADYYGTHREKVWHLIDGKDPVRASCQRTAILDGERVSELVPPGSHYCARCRKLEARSAYR